MTTRRPTPGSDIDALTREVAQILRPLIATAAEKGELLNAELRTRTGGPEHRSERGLAPAVRRAAEYAGADEVRAAAYALERRLRARHGMRDAVK